MNKNVRQINECILFSHAIFIRCNQKKKKKKIPVKCLEVEELQYYIFAGQSNDCIIDIAQLDVHFEFYRQKNERKN